MNASTWLMAAPELAATPIPLFSRLSLPSPPAGARWKAADPARSRACPRSRALTTTSPAVAPTTDPSEMLASACPFSLAMALLRPIAADGPDATRASSPREFVVFWVGTAPITAPTASRVASGRAVASTRTSSAATLLDSIEAATKLS